MNLGLVIAGILGMINLLLKTPLDPQQLDYARTAEASGKCTQHNPPTLLPLLLLLFLLLLLLLFP